MLRSVLLLMVSALLLSAAVGLPLSLEESDESGLEQLLQDNWESEEQLDLDSSHGNSIHKRAAKDSSGSSEEHKDKAKDKVDSSSSEEHKTTTVHADEESTTQAAARRRRETLPDRSIDSHVEVDGRQGPRRQDSSQYHGEHGEQKGSEELKLDAQAEKELDEEMARAVAEAKDNGSIEDYAQGCGVMEVSSKEANEATYAE